MVTPRSVPAARAATLLALATLVPTMSREASSTPPRTIEVQGHRGARALRPENTLPGFAYALDGGVDVLELDLVVTKDDELVVMHDLELNPILCTGPDGAPAPVGFKVRQHPRRMLRAFDCGRRRNPRFPRQRPVPQTHIPTLDEVFELVARSKAPAAAKVRFNIEAKRLPGRTDLAPSPTRFAALIVKAIEARGLVERCILQSFDHRVLVAAKRLAPRLRTSALIGETRPDLVAVARAAGAELVSPNHEWITAEDVSALHAAGIGVVPWTANSETAWARLVELGVDGVITDDPAALIAYLRRRGLR